MTVSDAMINHYIEEFGLKRVTPDEIVGILANLGSSNVRANEAIVFTMLRKMLLAYFYRADLRRRERRRAARSSGGTTGGR